MIRHGESRGSKEKSGMTIERPKKKNTESMRGKGEMESCNERGGHIYRNIFPEKEIDREEGRGRRREGGGEEIPLPLRKGNGGRGWGGGCVKDNRIQQMVPTNWRYHKCSP